MDKIKLTNAEEIFNTPFRHPKMLIEGLLPPGLTFLIGDSKIGKSWMVLMFCLKLAIGESVWGLETVQTEVVYLALEDRDWRIQDRLHLLVDEAPEGLYFGFTCGKVNDGLEQQIQDILTDHPNVGAIFIDTLQMIRGSDKSQRSNAYAADYADIGSLKKLADDNSISIILVHHTRKEGDEGNIFNTISGSNGLMGAADASIVIKKPDRFENKAVLSITGRDVLEQQLDLLFVDNKWILDPNADISRLKRKPIPTSVLRVAEYIHKVRSFKGTTTELIKAVGLKDISPESLSKKMIKYKYEVFETVGIAFESEDKSYGRIKKLWVTDSCDGCDSYYRYQGCDSSDAERLRDRDDRCCGCAGAKGRVALAKLMCANNLFTDLPEYRQLTTEDYGFAVLSPAESTPF